MARITISSDEYPNETYGATIVDGSPRFWAKLRGPHRLPGFEDRATYAFAELELAIKKLQESGGFFRTAQKEPG